MADQQLIHVNVPTQIGKVGAPGKSCWVKFIGTPAVADGGSYGVGDGRSFCVDGEHVYTWDKQHLYRDSTQLDIAEPESGVFLMRVHDKIAYIWCHDLKLYTLSLEPLAAKPALVTWEGDPLLAKPLAMLPGTTGWLLTENPGGATRLSRWTLAADKATLTTVTLQSTATLGNLSALAQIGENCYVADAKAIYRVESKADGYHATSVLALPTTWGGIAGMLGQRAGYNDPAPDGSNAFARYLYVVDKADGMVHLVYPDYGKHSDTDAHACQGTTIFGNLQLDSHGLLYYLTGTATGDIRTVNVLDGHFFYLDQSGEAANGNTLLPNRLMGCKPGQTLTITFYAENASTPPIGTVALTCQAQEHFDDKYEYNLAFFQTFKKETVGVSLVNPYGLLQGPALMVDFKEADGNIVIGDIVIDPHVLHPIHPGKDQ